MMGIILSGVLMVLRVKGALFYSIIIITIVGIPMGVTHVPSGFSVCLNAPITRAYLPKARLPRHL